MLSLLGCQEVAASVWPALTYSQQNGGLAEGCWMLFRADSCLVQETYWNGFPCANPQCLCCGPDLPSGKTSKCYKQDPTASRSAPASSKLFSPGIALSVFISSLRRFDLGENSTCHVSPPLPRQTFCVTWHLTILNLFLLRPSMMTLRG